MIVDEMMERGFYDRIEGLIVFPLFILFFSSFFFFTIFIFILVLIVGPGSGFGFLFYVSISFFFFFLTKFIGVERRGEGGFKFNLFSLGAFFLEEFGGFWEWWWLMKLDGVIPLHSGPGVLLNISLMILI